MSNVNVFQSINLTISLPLYEINTFSDYHKGFLMCRKNIIVTSIFANIIINNSDIKVMLKIETIP